MMHKLIEVEELRGLVKATIDGGMSGSKLAREAKVKQSAVSRFYNGVTTAPDADFLLRLKNYFWKNPPPGYALPGLLADLPVKTTDLKISSNLPFRSNNIRNSCIPIAGSVLGGIRAVYDEQGLPIFPEEVQFVEGASNKNDYALLVHDSSFMPAVMPGYYAVFSPDDQPKGNRFALLDDGGGPRFVRITEVSDGLVMFEGPASPDGAGAILKVDAIILHLLVGVITPDRLIR